MNAVASNVLVSNAPILLILLPMVAAFVALTGKLLPSDGAAARAIRTFSILPLLPAGWVLAVSLPAVLTGPLLYELGGFPAGIGIALVLDGLAWISAALIALVTILVALASLPHREFDPGYFFFLHMTGAGMQSVVLTGDIFTMFVSFEIVAIGVYVLIAWEGSPQGLLAGLKYLFLSSVGILFFLFGVFLVYRDLGTLALAGISEGVAAAGGVGGSLAPGPGRSLSLAVAALCVGIGVRTAFIPFHTWLPEAHAWAPHPISAMLSGVLIKVSFFAMIRIIRVFDAIALQPLLLWIGAITALVAVIWALAQHDAKRLLAFHSISQMGYILAAWGAATSLSIPASYGHAINHALFKSLLFLAVGIAIHRGGSRNLYRLRRVATGAPLLAVALAVGSLAIAGIPPFNGYVSKQLVSTALYGSAAYPLLWLAGIGTVASFIKLSQILFGAGPTQPDGAGAGAGAGAAAGLTSAAGAGAGAGVGPPLGLAHPNGSELPAEGHRRLPWQEGTALVVLVALVLATGLAGEPFLRGLWRLAEVAPGALGGGGALSAPGALGGGGALAAPGALGGGGAPEARVGLLPAVFAADRLLGTLPTVLLGAVLAWVVTRRRIRALSHRLATVAPRLKTVLVFFVFGLVLFAIVPILAAAP